MKYPNLQKAIQQHQNLKMKVTPEQSAEVQQLCFANDVYWCGNYSASVQNTNSSYLYVTDQYGNPHYVECGTIKSYFEADSYNKEFSLEYDCFLSDLPNVNDYPNLKQLIETKQPIAVDTTTETPEAVDLFVKLCQLNGVQWFMSTSQYEKKYITLWKSDTDSYSLDYDVVATDIDNKKCSLYSVKDDELYDKLPSTTAYPNLRQLLRDKNPLCIDTETEDVELFLRIAKQESVPKFGNNTNYERQPFIAVWGGGLEYSMATSYEAGGKLYSLQYDMFYDDMPVSADGLRLDKFMELVETDCSNVEFSGFGGWCRTAHTDIYALVNETKCCLEDYRIKPKPKTVFDDITWKVSGLKFNGFAIPEEYILSCEWKSEYLNDACGFAHKYGTDYVNWLKENCYYNYEYFGEPEPVKQYPINQTTVDYLKSIADDARAYDINPDCIGDNETVVSDILGIKNDALLTIKEELDKITNEKGDK